MCQLQEYKLPAGDKSFSTSCTGIVKLIPAGDMAETFASVE